MNLLRLSKFKFIFIQGHITKTQYFTTIMLEKKIDNIVKYKSYMQSIDLICFLNLSITCTRYLAFAAFVEITSKQDNVR